MARLLLRMCCKYSYLNSMSRTRCLLQNKSFSTSKPTRDLMEFFEDKKLWNKEFIQCGRPWSVEELRLKSTVDLHKLWYVLIKERNMLLTMEEEYKRMSDLFPNPERIYKVEESMENLMEIVKERDRAYNYLETGKSGEPEPYMAMDEMGRVHERTPTEHLVPKFLNRRFSRKLIGPWINEYRQKEREKMMKRERGTQISSYKRKQEIMKRFPHVKPEDID